MSKSTTEQLLDQLEQEYRRVHTPDNQENLSDAEVEFAFKLYSVFKLLLVNARIGVNSRKEKP